MTVSLVLLWELTTKSSSELRAPLVYPSVPGYTLCRLDPSEPPWERAPTRIASSILFFIRCTEELKVSLETAWGMEWTCPWLNATVEDPTGRILGFVSAKCWLLRVRAEADKGRVGLRNFEAVIPPVEVCSTSLETSDPVVLDFSLGIKMGDYLAVSAPELSSSSSTSLVSVWKLSTFAMENPV